MANARHDSKDFTEAVQDKFALQDKEEEKENVFDEQMQFLHPDIVVRSDKMESAQGNVYFVEQGLQKGLVLKHVSQQRI